MRARKMISIVALVVAGAMAASAAFGDSDDFKPKSLKGDWTGQWRNLASGAEGEIVAKVKVHAGNLITTVDFSGDPLGCGDPPPGKATLEKGTGNNTWNAAGFKVDEPTAGFGDLILAYRADRRKITALGNPPCKPSTIFRLTGKLKDSTMSATVDITAADGSRTGGNVSADNSGTTDRREISASGRFTVRSRKLTLTVLALVAVGATTIGVVAVSGRRRAAAARRPRRPTTSRRRP